MKNVPVKQFIFKTLKINIYPQVYEPSEDSFQLLESIDFKKGDNIFEIGTGTGIISLYLCMNNANIICSDINPYAIKNTKENFKINREKMKGNYEVRFGDMFNVLKKDEKFDLIIFNPPYLPKLINSKIKDKWFNIAVEGGITGLKFTKKFILEISKYLKENGSAYFVYSSESDENKLKEVLLDTKLNYSIINSINYNSEELRIYRIIK